MGACRALIIEPNLGVFDNTLQRTAMQMFVVTGIASCEAEMKGSDQLARSWPGGCAGTVRMAREFDWRKLAALLSR